MTMVEKIKILCLEKGIKLSHLEKECGISRSSIEKWSVSIPRSDTLHNVAHYLGVTTEYLLGRTDSQYTRSTMITIERIFALMEERQINAMNLEKLCDIANGTISRWKQGIQKPTAEVIIKIAQFFNVTTDYLHGLSDTPFPIDPNTPAPAFTATYVIPPDVAKAQVAFHLGVDNITQAEIDDAAAFIRMMRDRREDKGNK
jgi:transcriptional regulator with XRE-family HTH domain